MRALLDAIASESVDNAEAFATLYMAWNDLIHEGVEPSDEAIIRAVYDWHASKRQRFSERALHDRLRRPHGDME